MGIARPMVKYPRGRTDIDLRRAFGLSVFERNFVESVFTTWSDWISLGAEPRLAAASGCGHRLINCEKCSGVAIIILDKGSN